MSPLSDHAPPSTGDREEQLLRDAVAGDEAALEELLLARHEQLVRHVERKMSSQVQGRVAAEDIVQQTYLQVFKSIGGFQPRGVGAFYAWLKTVAGRKLIDASRSRGREQLAAKPLAVGADPNGQSGAASLMGLLAASTSGPGGKAMEDELRDAFRVALANLPDNYRMVVQLRYLEDRSLEEVAERLSVSLGAARGLCHRARQSLRDEILRLSRYI
ncbi:ECF RNA polymerase sigma factor SigE [Planctomycetes bacterium MalM25]|nr:ECF RNA polymerase sigma factor SigE [Planctomycetes bacterium MalM25]